jgi:phage antirepressor YoqD-like protein/phage regulator Rha-like protein
MITSSIQSEQSSDGALRFTQSQNVARSEIVTVIGEEAVTTSIAIASGCHVDHASVIKLVRTYLMDLEEFGRVGFEIQTFQTLGGTQAREFAELNEQQSTLLLTYMRNTSVVRAFKKSLVKEFWRMAHAKPTFDLSTLNDPKVLLALLTDNVRKVVALEADNTELSKENHELEVKVEQDAPKVAFHDMVVVSHKTYNAAQAAKLIGTGRTRLLQFMRQKGWITRSNEPYQAKIEAGLLDVKLGTFEHPIQGTIPTCSTLITGKGLTKLEALWRDRDADLLA